VRIHSAQRRSERISFAAQSSFSFRNIPALSGVKAAKLVALSSRLSNAFIALAFICAIAATGFGAVLAPNHLVSIGNLLARAAIYAIFVLAATATALALALSITGAHSHFDRTQFAIRVALPTLWLPPLLMFSAQRSGMALFLWAVLVVEIARLVACTKGITQSATRPAHSASDGLMFCQLKRDFPSGLSTLGLLAIQGALFAAVADHLLLSVLLYLVGTCVIAYRALQMFEQWPEQRQPRAALRPVTVVLAVSILIAFAWLPDISPAGWGSGGHSLGSAGGSHPAVSTAQSGGTSSPNPRSQNGGKNPAGLLARLRSLFAAGASARQETSVAFAKRLLDSTSSPTSDGGATPSKSALKTKVAIKVPIVGPIFPGVVLYPDLQKHTQLIAPPLAAMSGPVSAPSDPLSVPFDGVYWFWRGVADQPPSNSVVMHGSPSARSFRSTDGDGMSMEARQNLGFTIDVSRYRAIQLVVENADPFPGTVSIVLKIRNTTDPAQPPQSLGIQQVPGFNFFSGSRTPSLQTLIFRIPNTLKTRTFDELVVSFYLKGPRADKSARIAIDRFQLVPTGG
jgi:FtsH-binding integral membrane protein